MNTSRAPRHHEWIQWLCPSLRTAASGGVAAALWLGLSASGSAPGVAIAHERGAAVEVGRLAQLQQLTDDLRDGLAIEPAVIVTLVDHNPLRASVGPMKDREGTFLLSMERGFIDTLADDELEAVVAHELGHVWIYSNHPYLQTEQLANRIALRRVTRDSLERVYEKLWGAGVVKGSLSSFLGLPREE
jgi:hypothetical protein